jgi:hypothetical protein
MRRAGKTTFLWQLLAERARAGTPRGGMLYFSFEDERLAGLAAADLGVIVEEFYRLNPHGRDTRRAALFLDEVQLVPGWERFARRLLDTEHIELFLSGSSARLLSREVATSMRGRAVEARVFPFSFREYLRHQGREPAPSAARLSKAARTAVERALESYLNAGGFPEAQGLTPRDRADLLRGYVDVVLLRDVIERHGVTHAAALRWMVRHLLGNAGGAFSVHRLTNDLRSQGLKVGKDTLYAYLEHLEDAFLVHTVPVATASERRRMSNPRKAYPADPALIPVFDRSGANTGHALETCVALELLRRGCDLAYVRTAGDFEVDFLARSPDGAEALIQVCADLGDAATREREVRALLAARDEHPEASLHLVTQRPETARDIPAEIALHSMAVWLLEAPGR